MGLKYFIFVTLVCAAAAQTFRVCIPDTERSLCSNLDRDGSQVICTPVESRVDCALKMSRLEVDIGVFSEEETLLLAHQQHDSRIVATIRDATRQDPYAFEAVAVVPSTHTGGLEGLSGARYCHPGFDINDQRWSPRVLKSFEQAASRSDRCPNLNTNDKSFDELEVETLNSFFSAACRPGPWSVNATHDEVLKRRYPNLCSLCGSASSGSNAPCSGYTIDMGTAVAGVSNTNRHIQALECMRTSGNSSTSVAYVAWQHVREFFTLRNPQIATSYALLCEDGTTRPLTAEVLNVASAPCAFVRQPWSTVVASSATATQVASAIQTWWPSGANPGTSWQSILYNGIIGGVNARVNFESPVTPANYTSTIRNITGIDATSTCLASRRWCTISTREQTKCTWLRSAAHILGIQPGISCVSRANVFECLRDISENQLDLHASSSNYGYLARQHYRLSPVKLVQNSRATSTRVAAFVKETSAQSAVTRFENLKGKKACFPEYGGIAYVSFVRTAHERLIISATECDYARAVGEFFDSACAPGAVDAAHALSETTYNATNLCSVCQPSIPTVGNYSNFICSWDYTNLFFGNNGSLACLNDASTDVAVLTTRNMAAHLTQLNIPASQFRALCRNNSLAQRTGTDIDDGCLLSVVSEAEIVTRRNEPLTVALGILLETLEKYFGYAAENGAQLINFEMFSPFDGVSDLLFRDSAIGLSEPTLAADNEHARNYIELFQHLQSCTGSAPPGPTPGYATRNFYSLAMLVVMAFFTHYVIY